LSILIRVYPHGNPPKFTRAAQICSFRKDGKKMGGRNIVVSAGIPSFFASHFSAYIVWFRPKAGPRYPRLKLFCFRLWLRLNDCDSSSVEMKRELLFDAFPNSGVAR
jgi:hypothetical protein